MEEGQSQYAPQQLLSCAACWADVHTAPSDCQDYDQGWACLSLVVLAWHTGGLEKAWPTKLMGCGTRWIFPTHVSHLLPPARLGRHVSVTAAEARADVLPASLHGCVTLLLPNTQTHSPGMIYCLAACGTTLGPDSCECVTVGGSL